MFEGHTHTQSVHLHVQSGGKVQAFAKSCICAHMHLSLRIGKSFYLEYPEQSYKTLCIYSIQLINLRSGVIRQVNWMIPFFVIQPFKLAT